MLGIYLHLKNSTFIWKSIIIWCILQYLIYISLVFIEYAWDSFWDILRLMQGSFKLLFGMGYLSVVSSSNFISTVTKSTVLNLILMMSLILVRVQPGPDAVFFRYEMCLILWSLHLLLCHRAKQSRNYLCFFSSNELFFSGILQTTGWWHNEKSC